MTDMNFDRVNNNGDLRKEILGACIENEEANITEEEQVLVKAEKKQADFQKFMSKILRRLSL